jgi:hypothetical protein
VVHWPNGADEHQAHDAGLVLVCVGDGLVVVCTGLGDIVVGTGLGGELGDGLEDALGTGPGGDAGPDCAAQWSRADLAGHFAVAATDTRVSFADARQAVTVTCRPDAPDALAKFTASAAWLPASAYPPTTAAASTDSAAARGTSFLGFL